jgi:hypothetical protein
MTVVSRAMRPMVQQLYSNVAHSGALQLPMSLLQYCTASPSTCCLEITYRLYRLLFAVWSAAHKTCLSVRAPASITSITTASWCRSSPPSRTFASVVTDALFLDMHAPTRDDAAMSDPPCQIRCRWVIVAECTMVVALR